MRASIFRFEKWGDGARISERLRSVAMASGFLGGLMERPMSHAGTCIAARVKQSQCLRLRNISFIDNTPTISPI